MCFKNFLGWFLVFMTSLLIIHQASSDEIIKPFVRGEESNAGAVINMRERWEQTAIPVCWIETIGISKSSRVQRDASLDTPKSIDSFKEFFRQLIVREFGFRLGAGLSFVYWKSCENLPLETKAIRIKLYNNPNLASGGHSRVGPSAVTFKDEATLGLRLDYCKTFHKPCRAVIIHEFAHALGLYHAQDRNDTRCFEAIDESVLEDNLAMPVGEFAFLSIMNYCAQYENVGELGDGDRNGLSALFGTMAPHILEGARALNPLGSIRTLRNPGEPGGFQIFENTQIRPERTLWCDIENHRAMWVKDSGSHSSSFVWFSFGRKFFNSFKLGCYVRGQWYWLGEKLENGFQIHPSSIAHEGRIYHALDSLPESQL